MAVFLTSEKLEVHNLTWNPGKPTKTLSTDRLLQEFDN